MSIIEAKKFVHEYVTLCNKYNAEVIINNHGVHMVQFDNGKSVPFSSVYPAWDEEARQKRNKMKTSY